LLRIVSKRHDHTAPSHHAMIEADCQFDRTEVGIRCRQCGYERNWNRPDLPKRNCGKFVRSTDTTSSTRAKCRHLGDELRRQECPTCQGTVKLKVFACAIHGECTPETPLEGVACCASCPDWANPATSDS
jgi:hypothetical protein